LAREEPSNSKKTEEDKHQEQIDTVLVNELGEFILQHSYI